MSAMITAAEVAEIMACSESMGYKIIKELNEELKTRGYIIRPGRVSRKYFFERTGLELVDNSAPQEAVVLQRCQK